MPPNPLRIEASTSKGVLRLAFSGEITEGARFDQVGPLRSAVVLDLGGIRRINSCGVREWMNFIRAVPSEVQLRFEACSCAMVTQANMIANFLGAGRLVSFSAPYYCPKCQTSSEVLLDVERDFPGATRRAPARACGTCGGPLTFDDVEESYLALLGS
jgi:hypothetical protein